MGHISIRNLRRRGVSDEDIELGLMHQAAQRRANAPVQSLAVICGVVQPRSCQRAKPPVNLTDRQLARGSRYDQASLLLKQQALAEASPERAAMARAAAAAADQLSLAVQLEFDLLGDRNVLTGFQYHQAISARLRASSPTMARADEALAMLWTICNHLGWQTYECTLTAADLADLTGKDKAQVARALDLLESVGAIHRVKRGRFKKIAVTPGGAYRGHVASHNASAAAFKLDVIDGGKRAAD